MGFAVIGCHTPFEPLEGETTLQEYVHEAVQRELAPLPEGEQSVTTADGPSPVEDALAERREELDRISPFGDGIIDPAATQLGLDLAGDPQQHITLNLQQAILSAVENNIAVQSSRLQPAISAEDVIGAKAVFDWLLFGDFQFTKTDQPTTVPSLGGILLGSPFRASETYFFDTGVRKQWTTGATLSISTDLSRTENQSPGIGFVPDPAYDTAVRFAIDQPLLRGFGTEVNTISIRMAEHAEQRSTEQLRRDLMNVLQQTEIAYWNLVLAWQQLSIQQWLVDVGVEVRDILERRMDFDTRLAQYADAVATVEQRQANVIRARRQLRSASDALKLLMNDPALTIGSEVLLVPADQFASAPVTFSLREAILSAVAHRPEIKQAALDIEDARLRQLLADNQRLPLLNLSAQMAYFGLDDSAGDSYDRLGEGSFIDYLVGLAFEYPLGNRAAEAGYRQARLQRTASVLAYRQSVQNVVSEVKTALHDVLTNYELIRATRSFRVAQAENLRALLVEEETLAGLTPEFLDLKFNRQNGLASARAQELQALVEYQNAVAGMYNALGTTLDHWGVELNIITDPNAPLINDGTNR